MRYILSFSLALLLIQACGPATKGTEEKGNGFQAVFHTTQGDFTVDFHPEWAPTGVAHVRKLIESDFYRDIAIYRVVDNYVVQFGINNDSSLNSYWIDRQIRDEDVLQPNAQWTMSFARDGADTRDTQLFINLKNNSPRLDTINYLESVGFPVIGEVTQGTAVIERFYKGYGNTPAMEQDSIYAMGNAYLKRKYPELDYILEAEILVE